MPAPVQSFFHPDSHTFSYVVHDPATRHAALIDAALDYDADSGTLSDAALQPLLDHVRDNALDVRWTCAGCWKPMPMRTMCRPDAC